MIIVVANTTNESGKTTVALNVAVEAAGAGHNVMVVDTDRNGALLSALANREEGAPINAVQYVEVRILRQQMALARFRYDDVIIDACAGNSELQQTALLLADLVLIPFQDIGELDAMSALLAEVETRRGMPTQALAFQWMSHPREYGVARKPLDGIDFLAGSVNHHQAFSKALSNGYGILEVSYLDPKAAIEFRLLAHEITERVLSATPPARRLPKTYSEIKLMGTQVVIRVPFSYARITKLEAWAQARNINRVSALWFLVDNLE